MERMSYLLIILCIGLVFTGCPNLVLPPPDSPTGVAFSDLTANGTSDSVTTTALTLTFSADPTTLVTSHIGVIGATKGALSGSGAIRTLSISNITVANGETVTVAIANPAGFTISPASKTVVVYKAPTAVTFSDLIANGTSGTVTTTALTLTFDVDPTSLAAGDITVTGATKGALSGAGTSRSLGISAITVANGANVTVAIANPAGFTITPASRTVAVAVLGPLLLEDFSSRSIFPSDNWWNLDISSAPVDQGSNAYIVNIGGTLQCTPDFGPPPYGFPYASVPGTQLLESVNFAYADESDVGGPGRPPGYPVPVEARSQPNWIEGAVAGGGSPGDDHLILIDRDHWLLFEIFEAKWNAAGSYWTGGSGAAWNLGANDRRLEGWVSADPSGLAIFPGLVRYDEASRDAPIQHAFRVMMSASNGYVWPASRSNGSTAGALPMGARLRLKSSVDLSGYDPMLQRILQAMKTFGLIVADQGSSMSISGTMDARWNSSLLTTAFHSLKAADFEVIELGWAP
jgi:hypothetical protein